MSKIFPGAFAVLAIAASSFSGFASAADLQVDPNTSYFSGWTFNVSDNPRGCAPSNILPSTGSITGTLGPLTYEIHALGSTTSMPANQTNWVDCRWFTFGYNVPAGNNPPAFVDTNHVRAGNFLQTFSAPLPIGSLLFMQDFDGSEQTTITFRNCAGQAIDASGFDWLRVSAPSATTVIPTHTAGATWDILGTTGNSDNETTAIAIRSADVCQVETANIKPGVGTTGGRHFFFAMPPVTTMTVTIANSGGPSSVFSGAHQVALACTKDGIDVTAGILPAPPVSVPAGSAPGSVVFTQIPVGAVCTVTQTLPAAPSGYQWNSTPGPQTITTVSAPASNSINFSNQLNALPTAVPTLDEWALFGLTSLVAMLGINLVRRRQG